MALVVVVRVRIIQVPAHDWSGNTDVEGIGLVLWLQLGSGIRGVDERVSTRSWVGSTLHGLEIEGVIKFGHAKILRKIVKRKCRCDMLHSKREERIPSK